MKQRVAVLGNEGAPAGVATFHGLPGLVILFGVLGLLDGSWMGQILGSPANVRAMFGFLLCALVAVRFHSRLRRSPRMPWTDVRILSRELSRMVYLSLYLVIGIRQIIGIGIGGWRQPDGALHFGKFAAEGDLQVVIAYGLVGLLLIRLLAFGFWLHWSRSGANVAGGAALVRAPGRNFDELPRSQT